MKIFRYNLGGFIFRRDVYQVSNIPDWFEFTSDPPLGSYPVGVKLFLREGQMQF